MAGAEGATTLWAQATASSATIPLGALAGLIPDEVRSDDLFELVRRTAAALRDSGAGAEVLLVVDDAQLLDPASAALVLQLATARHVFVVVTVRSGEPTPDAVDTLWKDAGAHRVDLDRLDDSAIATLVETALGSAVEQTTIARIVDVCIGNPLYAREVVLGAVESGRIRQERGLWQMKGRPGVTPSLSALITRRIGTLTTDLRQLLEMVALGEPLGIDELTQVASYDALEAGEERGMVAISAAATDTDVRLAHPLYGDVIIAQLPLVRARSHRLRLAEVIQQRRPFTPDDALRATRLLQGAGAEIPGGLLVDAAAAANRSGDPDLAAELARLAMDAGMGLPAVLLLARAHMNRDRYLDAEEVLAAAEPTAAGDPGALEYVTQRLHVLYWALQRAEQAKALLDRGLGWSDDVEWRSGLEPWRVTLAGYDQGFAEQLASIDQALSQPGLDADARRGLENTRGMALLTAGRHREAEVVARRLRPSPPLRDDLDVYALGLTIMAGAESGEDRPGLRSYMAGTLRESIRHDDHETSGMAAIMLASLDIDAGCFRDAARWLAEAEIQFEHRDTFQTLTSVRALQVGIACFTGQPAAARAAADSMHRRIAAHGQTPVQQIYLACGEGWAARARGAADAPQVFLSRAGSGTDPTMRSRLLHEALRAGARAAPIAQALTELANEGDSSMMQARAAHGQALAARDAAALLAAADQLHDVGCSAAAVETAIAAAEQFVAQGREDSARRAAVRASELHPADQGWELPIIDGLGATAVQLTAREAQIAALAANGLSNQQIADQLVISVRTAETYVYRAMRKRGVDNRGDL
jgi:DNA-binding NarL/FixJ family response regulator